jgi:hypothetical protein
MFYFLFKQVVRNVTVMGLVLWMTNVTKGAVSVTVDKV